MSSETERDTNSPSDENKTSENNSQGTFKVPEQRSKVDIEREQEAKLKAKYGQLKKPGGGSTLLQKRLQKGSKVDIEREQEAKLKAKYGQLKKPGGGSTLLQKRLQKGPKYFDSGDYNMAKAKMNNPKHPLQPKEKLLLQESIGGAIPTPSEVEHMRRPSQQASNLVEGDGSHPLHIHQLEH